MDDEGRRARLGRAIRKARIWRGLRQSDVARGCAVDVSVVQKWEAGKSAPLLTRLDALCRTLDVSADYFRRAPDENVDRLLLDTEKPPPG